MGLSPADALSASSDATSFVLYLRRKDRGRGPPGALHRAEVVGRRGRASLRRPAGCFQLHAPLEGLPRGVLLQAQGQPRERAHHRRPQAHGPRHLPAGPDQWPRRTGSSTARSGSLAMPSGPTPTWRGSRRSLPTRSTSRRATPAKLAGSRRGSTSDPRSGASQPPAGLWQALRAVQHGGLREHL